MITRLQNFFLKHNKWLFGSLLCVIIVTFVLTIGPQSFFGSNSGPQTQKLDYFGYNLSSENDQRAIAFNSEISATLHPELGIRREQLMDYAYMRIAALGIANRLAIPAPTQSELEAYVKTIAVFQNPQTGEFSADSYNRMVSMMESSERFTKEALARVMKEDYRVAKVRKALGGPAYTLPFEMEMEYVADQTTFDIALATLDYSSFKPEVTPSAEELKAFYDQSPDVYRVPEKIKTSALLFINANYVDEVPEPTTEGLEAYFARNSQKYQPAPDPANPAAEVAAVDLATVKDRVTTDWKLEQARTIAGKKAESFTLNLWQNGVKRTGEGFDKLVSDYKIQVLDLPAFSRGNPPSIPSVPAQVLNSMWIYSSGTRYFSDIGQHKDGAVVVVFDQIVPENLPAFEQVIAQVEIDYIANKKQQLFSEKGEEIYNQLSTVENIDFKTASEDLGLTYEELEPFQGNAVPSTINRSLVWNQARNLNSGQFSRMIISDVEGTIVYIQEKTIPSIDKTSAEFQAFVSQRTQFANEAMGWSRLREITDTSLASVMEPTNPGE